MRLTESVRRAMLHVHEGYKDTTNFKDKNFREQRDYEISDGELRYRSRGKTSWADSRWDDTFIADGTQTHRFLRERRAELDTPEVREYAAEIDDEVRAARRQARAAEREALAQRQAETEAEADRDQDDSADQSTSVSGAVKVGGGIVGGLVLFGIGYGVWKAKVKPWLDARRERRAAEAQARPQAELDHRDPGA